MITTGFSVLPSALLRTLFSIQERKMMSLSLGLVQAASTLYLYKRGYQGNEKNTLLTHIYKHIYFNKFKIKDNAILRLNMDQMRSCSLGHGRLYKDVHD